jgi:hypothetical protein
MYHNLLKRFRNSRTKRRRYAYGLTILLLTKGSINLLEKNNIVHYTDFTKLNRADVRLMFGRGNIDRNQSQVEVIDTILLMKNLWYSDDTFHNIITSCQELVDLQ